MTRYIGDIHGDIRSYLHIIDGCKNSVQVGDFGYGFVDVPDFALTDRFIRGNHDNPALCRLSPNWIPDATVEDDIFYMGGAFSIDWMRRENGIDWWDDEQLSYPELMSAIDVYEAAKPRMVITHDCPEGTAQDIWNFQKGGEASRTRVALQSMLQIHKPEIWIFGHHHKNIDMVIDGTRFICLGINSFIDL